MHLHERKRAMQLIQFCSDCWAENLLGATVCERCGTPLSETEPIFYDQKLMRALHHPVSETREMAALLLGQRQDRHALQVLLSRLLEETNIGVLCAISQALGQLGDCKAVTSLAKRLAQPLALVVALTIVDALASLAQRGCWEALDVFKAPPPVAERVAKEIAVKLETLNLLYY
jgi:HEAT repeat protein